MIYFENAAVKKSLVKKSVVAGFIGLVVCVSGGRLCSTYRL